LPPGSGTNPNLRILTPLPCMSRRCPEEIDQLIGAHIRRHREMGE
jgi:hypothetical protein